MTVLIIGTFLAIYAAMLWYVYRCAASLRSSSWKIINAGFIVAVSYRLFVIVYEPPRSNYWWNIWPLAGTVIIVIGFRKLSKELETKRIKKLIDSLS